MDNHFTEYAAGYLYAVGIRECVIRDNISNAGQLLTITADTIVACAFIDNVVLDTASHVQGLPASVLRAHNCGIRECTFLDNTTRADIATGTSQGSPNILAVNNYWGTTDPSVIKTRIYDWFDDNAKAIIDFEPYLTSPDPDCPDASWTPLP